MIKRIAHLDLRAHPEPVLSPPLAGPRAKRAVYHGHCRKMIVPGLGRRAKLQAEGLPCSHWPSVGAQVCTLWPAQAGRSVAALPQTL